MTVDNTRTYLLNDSVHLLVEALMKRVAFWPPVEEYENEELKLNFACMLIEKYKEIIGSNKVNEITKTSRTEQEMLESILWEIEQKETNEEENMVFEDNENGIVRE